MDSAFQLDLDAWISNVCALKRDLTVSIEVLNDDPRIDGLTT